jgi:hypothetical protein
MIYEIEAKNKKNLMLKTKILRKLKMNNLKKIQLFIIVNILFTQFCLAQENVIIPDLRKIPDGDGWRVVNREAKLIKEDGQTSIYFEAKNQQGGVAWLDNFEFTNGTIEVDIKGSNTKGRSFVGIAFRGANDSTYDVVYFRPFNFDSVSNLVGHSVQYISHPDYPWYKLREEHPGQYESSVNPAPDPEKFFHAKIVVEKPKIRVYVNNGSEPSLVVKELTDRTGGKIGLWMDFLSEGTFANLKIIPSEN